MRPFPSSCHRALLALSLLAPSVSGQVLAGIPPCYQNCITQSGDFTCNGVDIQCICRLSNGNYLPNVITCIRANCDNGLNTNELLGPLQLGCSLAGEPIGSAAIANAENPTTAPYSPTYTVPTTVTSVFASAGTTFVEAIPVSVSSAASGFVTSTGMLSTGLIPTTAASGAFSLRTEANGAINIGGITFGGSPTSSPIGLSASPTGSEVDSSSSTMTSGSTSDTSSDVSTSTTASGATDTASSAPSSTAASTDANSQGSPSPSSSTPVSTANSGSPFSSGGDQTQHMGSGWIVLGLAMCAAFLAL